MYGVRLFSGNELFVIERLPPFFVARLNSQRCNYWKTIVATNKTAHFSVLPLLKRKPTFLNSSFTHFKVVKPTSIYLYIPCLKTHSNPDFCPFFTALVLNQYKFGINKVCSLVCEQAVNMIHKIDSDWFVSEERSHQENHWSRHSVICAWNYWNKCQHHFYHMSSRCKENTWYKITLSCDDY